MEKCEHGAKITHFCIYEYCSAKEVYGCENCLKKYHSHMGQGDSIKTEDVDHLAEKFSVENSVKPKCRQFQEYVFGFFTQAKTQISQTIDILCKGMVNKLGYPFLSNLNHLSSYKRIKNKQYKKLVPKELRKIYMDCRDLDMGSVAIRERKLYIEEIIQNFATIETMEKLMKNYENLAKRLCKNFKHDSSAFRKIQDLIKYLNTVLKIDQKQISQFLENDLKNSSDLLGKSLFDAKDIIKKQNSTLQQKECSKTKIHHSERDSNSKPTPQRNNSRSKYSHSRNFSIEKQVKMNDSNVEYEIKITEDNSNSYESKEKEISQRIEKLMKMISLKEKSVGKVLQNSSQVKSSQPILIPPPLLKYHKNQHQTSNEKLKKTDKRDEILSMKKSAQNLLKVETIQKKNLISKNLQVSPRQMKHSNSMKSFQEELITQNSNHGAKNQELEEEQKYKYGLVRLPSSESNFSDAENFFKSYLNSVAKSGRNMHNIQESLGIEQIGKPKLQKDRMSQSSPTPLKISLNNSRKIEDDANDQEKSAGLYLMALDKTDPDECIQYLKAALSYSPTNISAAEYLSSVYINQNKTKDCLDLCNEYLALFKKIQKPQLKLYFLINKSASLNLLGRYSESIMLLQSQVLNFDEPKIYKNLGDAYFSVGINEKCQYNYQKAIRLNPKLDEAMYNLAVCIFNSGNFFNAEIWISKALEINGKNVDYQTLKKEISKRLVNVKEENRGLY